MCPVIEIALWEPEASSGGTGCVPSIEASMNEHKRTRRFKRKILAAHPTLNGTQVPLGVEIGARGKAACIRSPG